MTKSAACLPQDDATRKEAPMYRGLLGYFPAALFRVAEHSQISDKKHNPGNPEGPTWARDKSSDHLDCIVRHLSEMHTDPDYHLRALAWRALAALQEHEERKGLAPGASARFPNRIKEMLERRAAELKDVVVRTPSGAHVLIAHPAQHMAVAAFKDEELRRATILPPPPDASVGEQLKASGYDQAAVDRFEALKAPDNGHSIHCECRSCA